MLRHGFAGRFHMDIGYEARREQAAISRAILIRTKGTRSTPCSERARLLKGRLGSMHADGCLTFRKLHAEHIWCQPKTETCGVGRAVCCGKHREPMRDDTRSIILKTRIEYHCFCCLSAKRKSYTHFNEGKVTGALQWRGLDEYMTMSIKRSVRPSVGTPVHRVVLVLCRADTGVEKVSFIGQIHPRVETSRGWFPPWKTKGCWFKQEPIQGGLCHRLRQLLDGLRGLQRAGLDRRCRDRTHGQPDRKAHIYSVLRVPSWTDAQTP